MCDTIVALGNSTSDGSVLFAKNSDRDTNEIQELELIPHKKHPRGSSVRCTYIRIPQVRETNAVLLSKPYWIWGAEIGANEHGVSIGNEALFTKVESEKEPSLIGMDFLRLALERANTACDALKIITDLLETYGQGGNCGASESSYYHNSFIIADKHDAWVLETAGRQWAAKQVKDVYSISNKITIGHDWDMASENLVEYAMKRGWCKKAKDFNFSDCYSHPYNSWICYANARKKRSAELLRMHKGRINVQAMMKILRDHGAKNHLGWISPLKGLTGLNLCMHIGCGPVKKGQTTGSMVSHIGENMQTHWVTGTSVPCTGIFKPIWTDTGLPENYMKHAGPYNKESLWWTHEKLNRLVMLDYETRVKTYEAERDSLESDFIDYVNNLEDANIGKRKDLTEKIFRDSEMVTLGWIERVSSIPVKKRMPSYYMRNWQKLNNKAELIL